MPALVYLLLVWLLCIVGFVYITTDFFEKRHVDKIRRLVEEEARKRKSKHWID